MLGTNLSDSNTAHDSRSKDVDAEFVELVVMSIANTMLGEDFL